MKAGTKWVFAGLLAVLLLSAAPAALAQETAHLPRWPAVQGRLEAKAEELVPRFDQCHTKKDAQKPEQIELPRQGELRYARFVTDEVPEFL